jgi:two-component system response regulator AtoC
VNSTVITNGKELARVLIVSQDASALQQLWALGRKNGWYLQTAESIWDALEQAQSDSPLDLLFLDISHGGVDGLRTLRWLRKTNPALPVVLLSNSDDLGQKREASGLGAHGYLVKPIESEQLEAAIRNGIRTALRDKDTRPVSEDVEQVGEQMFFVAAGAAMRKLRAQVELLAHVNVPVLIVGESGSGKEIAARLIHRRSPRSSGKFIAVNCAALPPDLLEQELFGQESGARGDGHARPGKFELGENGSILLNEITEMPMPVQSRLLRVLQDRQVVRVGGEIPVEVNVRVLAATNVNVERALAEKKFRDDLYYQLSAFTLQVPPLRERKEEIPILLEHSMRELARVYGLPERAFSRVILGACQAHSWPGNLRELENFVKRYLVIGDEELALRELDKAHGGSTPAWKLPDKPTALNEASAVETLPDLKSLVQDAKGAAERNAIAAALDKTHWNRKAAARLLRVSYRSLLYKIDQYHMSPPAYLSAFPTNHGANGNGHGS